MKWMELIDPTKLVGCYTYNIEQWTEPMLNEFRKKLVTKIIMSKENSRADVITAVQNMRGLVLLFEVHSFHSQLLICPPNDI
ncbi:hypothetical protein PIB30_063606 [Stylosanthes scabra]|uniref:Uncharacterized protein n=1 Tax=Stylosanthes scabra TaxID=79078 RepID=A0ABU6VMG4_9FABA|nr:hypothetical protein [Stylosanthes scabra]